MLISRTNIKTTIFPTCTYTHTYTRRYYRPDIQFFSCAYIHTHFYCFNNSHNNKKATKDFYIYLWDIFKMFGKWQYFNVNVHTWVSKCYSPLFWLTQFPTGFSLMIFGSKWFFNHLKELCIEENAWISPTQTKIF